MISEQRVRLAIAGMYFQGVFARKVTEVRETFDTLVLWRFGADGVIEEVVTSSLGFTNTFMVGYGLVNSISGGVIVAVSDYEPLWGRADMILYGVNIDGTEDTDRFQ